MAIRVGRGVPSRTSRNGVGTPRSHSSSFKSALAAPAAAAAAEGCHATDG